VRLNPATRNSTQIHKLSVPLFIFVILILLAVVIVSASLVAATLVRDAGYHRMSAYSRKVAGGIQSEKELAQGKFLVADRRLMDPNFRETVVLLIHYGPDGAMGLVMNRPLQLKLSTVLPDIKELDRREETLYLGGPVEPTRILLLVRSAHPPEASMPVFGDVYLSSSREELRRLIKKPDEDERFRIYAGYAGWAPKQLESECDRGHWHVLTADTETLFDKKSSEIWPELIQRVSVQWVRTINSGKLLEQSYPRNPVRRKIIKRKRTFWVSKTPL
jgi:putative transcriptional regulator